MMFYAVIDTNVMVSALLNMDSNPGRVLLSVLEGETALFLNEEIMSEVCDQVDGPASFPRAVRRVFRPV